MSSSVLKITVEKGLERERDVLARVQKVYDSLTDKTTGYAEGIKELIDMHSELIAVYKKYIHWE